MIIDSSSQHPPGSGDGAELPHAGPDRARRRRLCALALAAGALAGLGAWAAGEPIHGHFQAPLRRVVLMGYASLQTTEEDAAWAGVKNAVVAYGLLGGLAGLLLGVAGGLSERTGRGALVGGGVGLLVGLGLTAALTVPSVKAYWWYFGNSPLTEELLVPFLTHAVSWSGVGLAGGLALGLGARGGRAGVARAMLGGLLGAVVGAAVYEFAGAGLFPLDKTTFPLSASGGSRLLARMSVAALVGLFSAWGLTFGPSIRR